MPAVPYMDNLYAGCPIYGKFQSQFPLYICYIQLCFRFYLDDQRLNIWKNMEKNFPTVFTPLYVCIFVIYQKLTFFEASQNSQEIFFQNFLFVLLQDLSGNFQIYKNYGNPIYIGRDIQLSKSCPIYGTAVPKGLNFKIKQKNRIKNSNLGQKMKYLSKNVIFGYIVLVLSKR